MKKILIASPLHQKIRYFIQFQKSLDNLIIPEGYEVDRYYIVNNCDEIIPYISSGKYDVINFEHVQEKAHVWETIDLEKMSFLRNKILEYAKNNNYDYVFSVDTDLVLTPETLIKLVETKEDIVSAAFYTHSEIGVWSNSSFYLIPDFDSQDCMERCSDFIRQTMETPGLYPCGMTGACTLISQRVWEAGVNYDYIPYITHIMTEDRCFCLKAIMAGFQPMVDSRIHGIIHLYNDVVFNDYIKGKYNNAKESIHQEQSTANRREESQENEIS